MDESSFRSNQSANKGWQFTGKLKEEFKKSPYRKTLNLFHADPRKVALAIENVESGNKTLNNSSDINKTIKARD